MTTLVPRLVFAGLLVVACAAPGQGARAADEEKGGEPSPKRAALWQALEKSLPNKYQQIDAYAEDASLTRVLFRSQGDTLLFSLKTGKVEEVPHMKALGNINRITFEEDKGGGHFVLWYDGRQE